MSLKHESHKNPQFKWELHPPGKSNPPIFFQSKINEYIKKNIHEEINMILVSEPKIQTNSARIKERKSN